MISYPTGNAELEMLTNWQQGKYKRNKRKIEPVTSAKEIIECRDQLEEVKVQESVLTYLMQLVQKSRNLSDLQLGASPRAALNWLAAAKSNAAIQGKDFITPDDIKAVAEPVLRHRFILTPEAELEGVTIVQVIGNLLRQIAVPR
jgi:MoxR-like ATPase